MATQRCRLTYDKDTHQHSCYRETWRDKDRCIWHAKVPEGVEKPIDELRSQRETRKNRDLNRDAGVSAWMGYPAELLDRAILSGQDIGDEMSFDGCKLRDADFSNANLEQTNFTGATLGSGSRSLNCGANFREANLTGANFSGANLRDVDFSESDLTEADISNVSAGNSMGGDYVVNTNFSNATLTDANLSKSDFANADFSGADLSTGSIGVNTQTETTDLSESNFRRTNFREADLKHIIIENSSFDYADLTDAILFDTRLHGSDFRGAELPETDIRHSDLSTANLRNANLVGAALEESDLSGTDLRAANFDHVSLQQTEIRDITIDEETTFAPPSRWELEADNDAEAGCLDAWGIRRFRALNRSASDAEHLLSAERQYRQIQRLFREHDLTPNLELEIYEKHAKRKRLLAEGDHGGWVQGAISRWILGYGLRVIPIIRTMIIVILLFAFVYPLYGLRNTTVPPGSETEMIVFPSIPPNAVYESAVVFLQGLYFSSVTFSTVGYGDLSPIGPSRWLASFESFIGGLLMAYLVFVLGRRVTR